MKSQYHRQITTQALQGQVSARALDAIIRSNVRQDNLRGQIGHPEYHFDDNAFTASWAYVDEQRALILATVAARREPKPAWMGFGRLTHAVQDFYAHSNYLTLWQARYAPESRPPPDQVNALDPTLLSHQDLQSGRIYPLEALAVVGLAGLARRILPRDAHAWMNLDSPDRGPLFPYAIAAAEQHTRHAFRRVKDEIMQKTGASGLRFFVDFRQ